MGEDVDYIRGLNNVSDDNLLSADHVWVGYHTFCSQGSDICINFVT